MENQGDEQKNRNNPFLEEIIRELTFTMIIVVTALKKQPGFDVQAFEAEMRRVAEAQGKRPFAQELLFSMGGVEKK